MNFNIKNIFWIILESNDERRIYSGESVSIYKDENISQLHTPITDNLLHHIYPLTTNTTYKLHLMPLTPCTAHNS